MSNFQDSIEIYWCQLHLIFTWQEKRARWQSRAATRAVETSMDLPTARAAVKATAKRMQVGNVNVTWCRFFGAKTPSFHFASSHFAAWTLMYIVIWKSWGWSVERLFECPLIIRLYGLEHITYPYASRKVKGTSQPNRQPKYQTRWSEDAPHPVKQLEQANEVDRGISMVTLDFQIFRGLMKKKHRIFYAKKNGFPEYFTVGCLYNGCLLGPRGWQCHLQPWKCPPFKSEGVCFISTGSFRFLCAPKLRWWRHHLLQLHSKGIWIHAWYGQKALRPLVFFLKIFPDNLRLVNHHVLRTNEVLGIGW